MNPITKSSRNTKISIKGFTKTMRTISPFFASLNRDYQFYYQIHFRDCKRKEETLKTPYPPLSPEKYFTLITQSCTYCGRAPEPRAVHHTPGLVGAPANGIDKLDASLGYVEGNLVTACKDCNQMKSSRDLESFVKHVKEVMQYMVNKGIVDEIKKQE